MAYLCFLIVAEIIFVAELKRHLCLSALCVKMLIDAGASMRIADDRELYFAGASRRDAELAHQLVVSMAAHRRER